jgi:predicted tellurium resistance membrane protein TerC
MTGIYVLFFGFIGALVLFFIFEKLWGIDFIGAVFPLLIVFLFCFIGVMWKMEKDNKNKRMQEIEQHWDKYKEKVQDCSKKLKGE